MNVLFTTYTTLQSYKFDLVSSVEEYFILKNKKHLRPLRPWPQGPQATSLDLFVKLDHLKIASCCDSWTSMGWWYSNLHILLKPRVHSESNLKKIHFPNFHPTTKKRQYIFFLYLSSKSTYFFNVPFFSEQTFLHYSCIRTLKIRRYFRIVIACY